MFLPAKMGGKIPFFPFTLNVMILIYMVFFYVRVYQEVTGINFSTSTKKDPNQCMQNLIYGLLLTELFCVILICNTAYLRVAGVSLPLCCKRWISSLIKQCG